MESVRIQRLRCLSDTDFIQIKPITILLGQNSSGKSTFLRFFPLLKQSVESRTTGPILWYGRLVDFGNFDDAHQNGIGDTIAFSFKSRFEKTNLKRFEDSFRMSVSSILNEGSIIILSTFDMSVTLELSEDKVRQSTWTSKLTLEFEDSKVQLDFDDKGDVLRFVVNSLNILEFGDTYASSQFNRSLLPLIGENNKRNDFDSDPQIHSKLPFRVLYRIRPFINLFQIFLEKAQLNFDNSQAIIDREDILKIVLSFGLGSSEKMLENIKEVTSRPGLKNISEDWTIKSKEFHNLRDLIIANFVPLLLEKWDEMIANFSKKISYMGPLRATAERYYRMQDLAVDEVDYQGRNLTMFLRNLTYNQRKQFSDVIVQRVAKG